MDQDLESQPFISQELGDDFNDQETQTKTTKSNKIVIIFHLLFKTIALITYLIASSFVNSFSVIFMFIVVLLSIDFWVVKNISGRKLVGLRWWNEIDSDGNSKWIFESKPKAENSNKTDSIAFWFTQFIFLGAWLLFEFLSVLKLNFLWGTVCLIAIVLAVTNIWGYAKCEKDSRKKIQQFATRTFVPAAFSTLAGFFDENENQNENDNQ
ncbi:hypothetical protein M0811_04498 [Anaeramoeba ignava]|uniref:Golgi apparatus membrane protein TVP23 homolog n=1 Tax=Anaeramoeba ignava TaxID=1746090 RepID=A0A9Q0LU80_ANAIG|nr:hypothetical protein M0811_04498 [Anaeramoeba ignava]